MTDTTCEFTEQHYQVLLRAFLDAGYRFTAYDPCAGVSRRVVLRHDVDLSLEAAVRMAEAEAEVGVSGSYHVLLTAKAYNVLSADGRRAIGRIRAAGHRIGLHVDPMAINDGDTDDDAFWDGLAAQFEIAAHALGELDSYSVHRPAANGKIDALKPECVPFAVPTFADADAYRKALTYRSESRRIWRQGCACRHPADDGSSLHLVIHPVWWTERPISREDLLREYLDERRALVDQYLCENLSFYRPSDFR